MVKQEQEKSLTAPLTLPTASGRKARKASRTGAAGRLNIVRAQIRLPNDIEEDGGNSSGSTESGRSATNSAAGSAHAGKGSDFSGGDNSQITSESSGGGGVKGGYDGGGSAASSAGSTPGRLKTGTAKSVASMVRR